MCARCRLIVGLVGLREGGDARGEDGAAKGEVMFADGEGGERRGAVVVRGERGGRREEMEEAREERRERVDGEGGGAKSTGDPSERLAKGSAPSRKSGGGDACAVTECTERASKASLAPVDRYRSGGAESVGEAGGVGSTSAARGWCRKEGKKPESALARRLSCIATKERGGSTTVNCADPATLFWRADQAHTSSGAIETYGIWLMVSEYWAGPRLRHENSSSTH